MGIDNNYLFLLFSNLSHLLSVDLAQYKMHRVEEKYLDDAIKLFKEVNTNIELFASSREFNTVNLTSLNAIPKLYRVYDNNEKTFESLIPGNPKTRKKFFDLIYTYLVAYKEQKNLNNNLKILLSQYFEELASIFDKPYIFENLDRISDSRSKRNIHAAVA